jgi:hypothetical protein
MVTEEYGVTHFKPQGNMVTQSYVGSASVVRPMRNSGAKRNGVAGNDKRFEPAVCGFGQKVVREIGGTYPVDGIGATRDGASRSNLRAQAQSLADKTLRAPAPKEVHAILVEESCLG